MEHAPHARPRQPPALAARPQRRSPSTTSGPTAGILCFWIFAALALAGAFTAMARRTPWYVWAMPILMFFSVVFLVVETPRYRTPIDPFIVAPGHGGAGHGRPPGAGSEVVRSLFAAHAEGRGAADARGLTAAFAAASCARPSACGGRVLPPDAASTPQLRLRGVSRATRPRTVVARPGTAARVAVRGRLTSFATTAPAPIRCAGALRRRIAPPWSASALASQPTVRLVPPRTANGHALRR